MKKRLLITITLFVFISFQSVKDKDVFICTSVASKRYHLVKNCKGLSHCDTIIKITTKIKAERFGRTLCKWED